MASPKQNKLTEAAKLLRKLKSSKELLESKLKEVNEQIKQVAEVDLPRLMEDADIENFKVDKVGTVFLQNKLYASVLADDRPKLYDWLQKEGHGDLIKPWVFPQTLTAFAKEQLGEGNPLPDFLKATFIPTASIRKA